MGEAIVQQAKQILAESERINELIQQQQTTITGKFKLAVIPTIAPYILPAFLETYASKYPDVKMVITEMETAQIVKALQNNEIDAALVSTPLEEKDIKEYPIFFEPFVAYFSKDEPALKKRTITADDIAIERIWLLNEGHCMRNQVLDLCSDQVQRLQADKPYHYESSNVDTLRKMVDKSKGLTILPELATFEFTEDQMERIRYFEDPEPVREVSIVTNDYFVRLSLLQTIIDEKMRVQKKNRKILRIQSARL
jgi:LysR family hydrogen peroxide-inducible transcriptional activator